MQFIVSVLSHETWILDSGASDHMCSDKTFLRDLSTLSGPVMVSLPNGSHVQVTQQGKLYIAQGLILEHVLVIPNFKFNMLSVKRLCEQLHCTIQFTENFCTLQAHCLRTPLVAGKDYKGLYILDRRGIQGVQFPADRKHLLSVCVENKDDVAYDVFANSVHFVTWHERLGHMFHGKMKSILEFVQL